jgi:hypothetical protein
LYGSGVAPQPKFSRESTRVLANGSELPFDWMGTTSTARVRLAGAECPPGASASCRGLGWAVWTHAGAEDDESALEPAVGFDGGVGRTPLRRVLTPSGELSEITRDAILALYHRRGTGERHVGGVTLRRS